MMLNSIRVTWAVPSKVGSKRSPLLGYRLIYGPVDNPSEVNRVALEPTARQFTIRGLSMCVLFLCSVLISSMAFYYNTTTPNRGGGGGIGITLSICPSVFLSMCPSLSRRYLLKRSTIFNQTWYGGVLSWGSVPCRKIGSLSSVSRSQWGLIW